LWSEEEARIAEEYLRLHNRVVYTSQKLWAKPATKPPTLATVTAVIPNRREEQWTPYQITDRTKIAFEGLPKIQQSVIDFSRIGGLDDIIVKLREIIQIPLHYPELLERYRIQPPKGLLLYGPPGNGKTLIARAVSSNMGAKFIPIEGPELLSKYVGVAETQLKRKFEEAETLGNSVIFIDEIDSIASSRDKYDAEHQITIVATLLNLLDGIRPRSKVFVIGATNRLHSVDPALRRPGRFELEFEIPVPDLEARYDILTKYVDLSNRYITDNTVNTHFLRILSELTNGYSGADLCSLYREAVMNAIRRVLQIEAETGKILLKDEAADLRLVKEDFLVSLKNITPTSLRGVETRKVAVHWDEIVGLERQKDQLMTLHGFLSREFNHDAFHHRPNCLNLIFRGRPGSGKRTIVRAFASRFNYELLFVDVLDLYTLGEREVFNTIDEYFMKAKQVAPSMLYIRNLQYVNEMKLYIRKIINSIDHFSFRHKVIVVAEMDSTEKVPEYLVGYKAFNKIIDFDTEVTERELNLIFAKYRELGYKETLEHFLDTYKGKPIGQAVAEIQEHLLING
jgi:SpoVK/Ycf46/Vps4 family AAA+-type ATPase